MNIMSANEEIKKAAEDLIGEYNPKDWTVENGIMYWNGEIGDIIHKIRMNDCDKYSQILRKKLKQNIHDSLYS